jgi:hypothetical protein
MARHAALLSPVLRPIAAVIDRGPGELLHHYMETGMLKGLKARVEVAHARGTTGVRTSGRQAPVAKAATASTSVSTSPAVL